MNKQTILVKGDDWQGLYIDGELILQNHSLRVEDVLSALGISIGVKYANDEWLWDRGDLPDNVKDVVFDE